MICGGIDLGGTKIEARLFDGPDCATVKARRIATPRDSYANLLDALLEQIDWLTELAGAPNMPIGIAFPGIVTPDTGMVFASNICASGQTLAGDLGAKLRRTFVTINDCMAFALSESTGGAASDAHVVMGLVLGTGVGGGICRGGALDARLGGLAVEIGHVPLSADALTRHDLPRLPCGCGRRGCTETYVSGTGIANIAELKTGQRLQAPELVGTHEDILDIWADIAGECLMTIHLMLAPDCIVLGGGLSNLPNVSERLNLAMKHHAFGDMVLPQLVQAQHGDSSGARGAALLARSAPATNHRPDQQGGVPRHFPTR